MLCLLLARDPDRFAGELLAQVVTARQIIEAGPWSQRLVGQETALCIVLVLGGYDVKLILFLAFCMKNNKYSKHVNSFS